MTFRESPEFKRGQRGERLVADVLRSRGCSLVPACLIEDGGAPRLWTSDRSIVLPDLDVSSERTRVWVEVKTLTISPWNRRYGCNVHGIKQRLVEDYREVAERTHAGLWIIVCESKRERVDRTHEPTGVILGIDLLRTDLLPCLSPHAHSRECLVYWRRDAMKEIDSFDLSTLEGGDHAAR